MGKHGLSIALGLIFAAICIFFGEPYLGLVAIAGPFLALVLTFFGVTGAGIFTVLSGGGRIPIVAGVGFIVLLVLSIYSFFI